MKARIVVVAVNLVSSLCLNAAGLEEFRIISAASVNGNEIGVCFNRTVDARSAATPANYSLSDVNVAVTNAIVRTDQQSVTLQLSKEIVGYSFVLTVSNVRSADAHPLVNPVFAGGVLGHDIGGLDNTDIGEPGMGKGTVFGCSSQLFVRSYEVTSLGSGIGVQSDSFHYVYHRSYQHFDLYLRISSLETADGLAQAGLMARESLSAQSRHVSLLLSADGAGGLEVSTSYRPTEAGLSEPWPDSQRAAGLSFPVWLHLKRDGPTFSASVGTNGFDSIPLGRFEPNPSWPGWPERVFTGTATATSLKRAASPARAQYHYSVSPHGDVWPTIEAKRVSNALTLRWPSVAVLDFTDMRSVPATWIPLTNNIEFGNMNMWTFELPGPIQQRFFRVRFP
jgi:hypothetical protein